MEYSKKIEKEIKTQVLVIGAGMAGFGSAVAAARSGMKTLIIDRNAVMGGMATSGLVGPFMTCYDNDATEQVVKGIFDELCIRTEAAGGAIHPSKVDGMTTYSSYFQKSHCHVTPFTSEILEVVMEQMVLEAGAQILYEAQLIDTIVEDGKIKKIVVALKEGLATIEADIFIDCTGDADVAYMSGVPTVFGDVESGNAQPCSLFFEVGNIDRDVYVGELERRKAEGQLGVPAKCCWYWLVDEGKADGTWRIDRDEIGNYETNIPGRWKINCSRMAGVDATKAEERTKAIIEGRKQVLEIADFMRKRVPGCENMQILEIANSLGVRETRHIEGEYTLTTDDIMSRKNFEDAICTFAYAVDIHNSTGGGVAFTCVDRYYNIPYRCLVPKKIDNLLVAGRCISGTSGAAASYRVMPSCVVTGEAAGTAAAIAINSGKNPKDIDTKLLQETLIKNGNVIKLL